MTAHGKVTRYFPFKAYSLPELTEPPSYFRREVRQYYQMNWRQLGEYIASLRQAGFDTARLAVQWQKKFAFPLIAAIIVLLGAPFAFLGGNARRHRRLGSRRGNWHRLLGHGRAF